MRLLGELGERADESGHSGSGAKDEGVLDWTGQGRNASQPTVRNLEPKILSSYAATATLFARSPVRQGQRKLKKKKKNKKKDRGIGLKGAVTGTAIDNPKP